MSNNSENNHIYFVDAGIGTKSYSCPYTHYEDGRDVYSYVFPPKGYELTGFKLEPYESDNFYDGKIVAQYEKISFAHKLTENLWLYILAALAIVGVLAVLAFYVFDFPGKSKQAHQRQPNTTPSAYIVDTLAQDQVTDNPTIIDTLVTEDIVEEVPETEEITLDEIVNEEVTETVNEENAQVEESPIEQPVETTVKENEVAPNVTETNSQPTETVTSTEEVLTKEQFKVEFWNLIHRKESNMRAYGNLYRKYKSLNLKSREFYYLYLTILESGRAFNVWKGKLLSIPDNELKSIQSISELTKKIEQYE